MSFVKVLREFADCKYLCERKAACFYFECESDKWET